MSEQEEKEILFVGSGNLICDLLYFQGQSCTEKTNESFLFINLDISAWEALSYLDYPVGWGLVPYATHSGRAMTSRCEFGYGLLLTFSFGRKNQEGMRD